MNESRNLILAIILSVGVIFYWEAKTPRYQPAPQNQASNEIATPAIEESTPTNNIQITEPARNIHFENNKISGSINLRGLRFSDLTLKKYDVEKDSEDQIKLLQSEEEPYFIEIGWMAGNLDLPNNNSVWQVISGDKIDNENATKLQWNSPTRNLTFIRTIALDDNYLFKISDEVINNSNSDITIKQYGIINKAAKSFDQPFFILHEGPIGVFNNALTEIKYKKLVKKGSISNTSQAGWAGISDKYWASILVPNKNKSYDYRFTAYEKEGLTKFQSDFQSENIIVRVNSSYKTESLIFSGAKEIDLIDNYKNEQNIELFDRTIDFGILYFLTKPIYLLLKLLNNFIDNFGLAIIALTIIIRLFLFPLASKSFREMAKMKDVQPEVIRLREECKDDKMRLNREVMKLYSQKQIKPMMGCLPVIIQVFVFFALYKVLFVTIDMRHAEFYGWIHDLTAPDPTSIFNLFGLLPYDLGIPFGIWPCILCFTMVLQQKLNPPPADPMQAKMMKFLPYFFVILFAGFPAGLVLYWTFNNSFSIAQQYYIMKQTDEELTAKRKEKKAAKKKAKLDKKNAKR